MTNDDLIPIHLLSRPHPHTQGDGAPGPPAPHLRNGAIANHEPERDHAAPDTQKSYVALKEGTMTREELIHRLSAALVTSHGDRYAAIRLVLENLAAHPDEAIDALRIIGPAGLRQLLPQSVRGPVPAPITESQPPRAEWTVGLFRAHVVWMTRLSDGMRRRVRLCERMLKVAKSDREVLGRDILPRLKPSDQVAARRMLGLQVLAA